MYYARKKNSEKKNWEEYLHGRTLVIWICVFQELIKFPLLIDTIHDQIDQSLSNLLEITSKQKTWDNF